MTKFGHGLIGLLFLCLAISDCCDAECRLRGSYSKKKKNLICKYGIDAVIPKIVLDALPDIHQLDPLPLSNSSMLMAFKLRGGSFTGLSTLRNITPIAVSCDSGDDVSIDTTLEMRDIRMEYKWSCLMSFFHGMTEITSPRANVHLKAVVCMGKKDTGMEVTDFSLVELEKFRLKFTGLYPLNWVVDLGGDAVLFALKEYLMFSIKNTLLPPFESFFASLMLPF